MFSGPRESGDSAAIRKTSAPSKNQQLQQGLQGSNAAAAGQGQQAGIRVRERKFENGDRYRGGWLNGLVSEIKAPPVPSQLAGWHQKPPVPAFSRSAYAADVCLSEPWHSCQPLQQATPQYVLQLNWCPLVSVYRHKVPGKQRYQWHVAGMGLCQAVWLLLFLDLPKNLQGCLSSFLFNSMQASNS